MCKDLNVLQGERISLRPITLADTDLIVRWRNNPAVRKNFIFRERFTSRMHQEWMHTKIDSGAAIQYIIEERISGRPIGSVYYRDIDRVNKSAEYGIFIGEDYARGKGYGTEAARLFTTFGILVLGLHRITLRVLAGNEQAYRSYVRAGFQKEGVAREMVLLDGWYQDVIFMAILESNKREGNV